jgi:hypothetical protein
MATERAAAETRLWRLPDWLPPGTILLTWAVTRMALVAALPALRGSGDGVMDVTHQWASALLHGDSPYSVPGLAYPPLAMFLFALPGLGGTGLSTYRVTFPLLVLAADFAGLLWAWRADRDGRRHAAVAYTLALPMVGPLLFLWRYDVLPAVCHLAALVCALRGRRSLSWLWLGIGIALKPYLIAVAPFWLLWELRAKEPGMIERMAKGTLLAVGPSIVAALALAPIAGGDIVDAYSGQIQRGLQLESVPAVLLAQFGRSEASFSQDCLCWQRVGPAAEGLQTAFTAILVVTIMGLALWFLRRPDADRLVGATCAAVVGILLTYRVFSPQFLVWPLPPLALLAWDVRRRWAIGLVAVAALLAAYGYPWQYGAEINFTGIGRWLLLGRIAFLVGAFALLILEGAGTVPRRSSADPPGPPAPSERGGRVS